MFWDVAPYRLVNTDVSKEIGASVLSSDTSCTGVDNSIPKITELPPSHFVRIIDAVLYFRGKTVVHRQTMFVIKDAVFYDAPALGSQPIE
jgi:hypothetical protein